MTAGAAQRHHVVVSISGSLAEVNGGGDLRLRVAPTYAENGGGDMHLSPGFPHIWYS